MIDPVLSPSFWRRRVECALPGAWEVPIEWLIGNLGRAADLTYNSRPPSMVDRKVLTRGPVMAKLAQNRKILKKLMLKNLDSEFKKFSKFELTFTKFEPSI